MTNFIEDFQYSLAKGFIDKSIKSKQEYLPGLLVNDKEKGKKVKDSDTDQINDEVNSAIYCFIRRSRLGGCP